VQKEFNPADLERIEQLAYRVIEHYEYKRPPIPIEEVLAKPPQGMQSMDMSDLSLVFGIGEHRYEYRMAMGRLFYREIARHGSNGWAGEEVPYNNDASRYFSACLLAPLEWVQKTARRPLITLEQLSEIYKVPEYVMSSRLAQLGKRVRGM